MNKFLITIVIFFMLGYSSCAMAASISLYSVQSVNVGDKLKVSIKADTEQIAINSIDLTLSYPENLVEFIGYEDKQSLVKMWISPPHVENGQVKMSGVIPGGANGLYDINQKELGQIPLAVLVFKAKNSGSTHLYFTKTQILKNDGFGSELAIVSNDLTFSIKNDSLKDKVTIPNEYFVAEDQKDVNPPNPFTIDLIDPSILSATPQMVAFNATDDESGIKYYKVKINNGEWDEVQSPVSISRGLFSKDVYVRAYDFSDNYRESSISVPGSLELNYFLWAILVIVLSSFIWYKLVK